MGEAGEASAKSLLEAAHHVLSTARIQEKARLSLEYARLWKESNRTNPEDPQTILPREELKFPVGELGEAVQPLAHSARPDDVEVVLPGKAPKRNAGGSGGARIVMVHALAHIESYAIDLSWDIILRAPAFSPRFRELPSEFWDDWLVVAEDEARHFTLLEGRLKDMESHYGAVPVHEGLWESALDTKDDLMARLAVVHMVHEARGLDVTPKTIHKMRSCGDKVSSELLEVILGEEITHVTKGCKWFEWIDALDRSEREGEQPAEEESENKYPHLCANKYERFHAIVKAHFHGNLKPPFNTEARQTAGMDEEYYLPLAQ